MSIATDKTKKKIVVVGGGTGSSTVLSGLKNLPNLELTAVVVVSDSGGSTGRLRDEFGFLPVGDARQCLAAMAQGEWEQEVRDLLLYRFGKGKGLKGHNLGNLILTALEDMAHSPGKAIEIAANIFRIRGQVLPSTEENIDLVITYGDGQVEVGEHNLDEIGGKKIKELRLSAQAQIYPKAATAIREADLVILGPGDLYGSLLPNTIVNGFSEALSERRGKFVYLENLMTHYTQTNQMSASDHLDEVIKYTQNIPDIVVLNSGEIPADILEYYQQHQEFPVVDDLVNQADYQIVRQDLVHQVKVEPRQNDQLERSVLRHDPTKVARLVKALLDR